MSSEEKNAWVMGIVAAAGLVLYVVIILSLAGSTPLTEVDYVPVMLYTIGGSIVAIIVVRIIWGIFTPRGESKTDQRDREIYQTSERIGQSFLVIGGLGALVLTMFESDYFWIANALYLGFALSGLLSCTARVIAYRRGFQSW